MTLDGLEESKMAAIENRNRNRNKIDKIDSRCKCVKLWNYIMEGVLVKEFSFELCTDWDQMAMQIADIYPIGPDHQIIKAPSRWHTQ